MKVAIQGVKGSFHHIVAEQYFGKNIDLVECLLFSEMPDKLIDNKADVLIMAIENSIAGAILPNYALIDEHQLNICGEHYLPIHHNLMGIKGQSIEDIKEVYSHPMALLQCRKFFKKHPHIKLIEDKDTAEVAKRIEEGNLMGVGAIASNLAAETYHLEILASEIQTINENATRFFILNNSNPDKSIVANKASIKFVANNDAGSLAEVLSIMAKQGLNLTKIQSMPIIDTPWKYAFFVDFIFNDYSLYSLAMEEIKDKVLTLKILGEYTKSKR